jgi:tRNA threonylcarbamoyladenosine biosynthesis protein TsaB
VALTAEGELLAETTSFDKGTHAKRLLPMVDALLKRTGVTLSDVDGFAATIGPGSFTGLRIGLSTLKGLAAATGKPVAVLSTLEALAHQCTVTADTVCPLLDARKKEVYYCYYRRVADGLRALTAERNAPALVAVSEITSTCAFIGDGAALYRERIEQSLGGRAMFAPPKENTIRAATVAFLANKRFQSGQADDPYRLVPHYIRASDAVRAQRD